MMELMLMQLNWVCAARWEYLGADSNVHSSAEEDELGKEKSLLVCT